MDRERREEAKWAGKTHPYPPDQEHEGNGPYCSLHVGGRYLFGRLLGSGGTSQVYEALQLNLRRGVAIKVLHPALVDDERLIATFHREALLVSQLNHRNIVSVIDCCSDDAIGPYIVTELFSGSSLADLISYETTLDVGRAALRMQQVLDGLGCAHGAGIVHADLKPANIMVETTVDGDEELKLLDFGSAISGKGLPVVSDMFYGTPSYIAPEVIGGENPGVAADIYAAGIVFYELLSGELPFSASSLKELLQLHLTAVPPSIGDSAAVRELGLDPALVAKLDAVIRRAMAKEPGERFSSAKQFAHSIGELIGQVPDAQLDEDVTSRQRQAAMQLLERIESLSCEHGEKVDAEASALWLALGHVRQAMGEHDNALVAAFRALQLSIRSSCGENERRSDALIAELIGEASVSDSVAELSQFPVTIAPRRTRRSARTDSGDHASAMKRAGRSARKVMRSTART